MRSYKIEEAKREIKAGIRVYLQKDREGNYVMREVNRLPFLLRGAPGIGKTEMAKQIAQELGIGFVSLSITHHTRNTILGLPQIRSISGTETDYTEYTMSEMIAMVERKVAEGFREGILLIDEFACMAESLVPPMLAFLQTKNIGRHVLPEGWVILLCSNPPQYNRSSRDFDMAIMDRIRVMDVTFDVGEFLQYGEKMGLHPLILEYLRLYPGDAHICRINEDGEKIIVTTRGWENLSWCIQGYETIGENVSPSLVAQYIKSDEVAYRFCQFYLSSQSGMTAREQQEILDGVNLEAHGQRMKNQSFQVKFQTARLLGDCICCSSGEVEQLCTLMGFMEDVRIEVMTKKRTVLEIIRERLNGECGLEGYENMELTETEKRIWKELEAAAGSYTGLEDMDIQLTELDEAHGDVARKVRPLQEELGRKIGNVCRFLESIQGRDSLVEPFVSQISRNVGVMDSIQAVGNAEFMHHWRKLMGDLAV